MLPYQRIKNCVVLAVVWLSSLCASHASRASSFQHTIAAEEVRHVRVGLISGCVKAVGWNRNEIIVEADEPIAVRKESFEVTIGRSEGHLPGGHTHADHDVRDGKKASKVASHLHDAASEGARARSANPRAGGGDGVALKIPKDVRLSVHTVDGDVEIENVNGRMRIVTVNGDINVRSSKGPLDAETVDGSIDVSDLQADLALQTVSGDLSFHRVHSLLVEAKSVSGDVLMDATDARTVRVSSHSGDVVYAGDVAQDGHLEIRTFSGDVEVRLPSSRQCTLEAKTRSGSVRVERDMAFSLRSENRVHAHSKGDGPQLKIASFSGDIHVK